MCRVFCWIPSRAEFICRQFVCVCSRVSLFCNSTRVSKDCLVVWDRNCSDSSIDSNHPWSGRCREVEANSSCVFWDIAIFIFQFAVNVRTCTTVAKNIARFTKIIYFCSYRSEGDDEEDLSNNKIVKFSKSLFQFTSEYDGDKFFTSIDGKRVGTPLLLVLLVIEISDVIFAVDSIPAVFGVTVDPFVVYTSNIFAILSLRGLFGFVSSALTNLVYLEKSVATVLGFIGLKIILDFTGHTIPTEVSLGIVVSILGSGVIASLLRSKHD